MSEKIDTWEEQGGERENLWKNVRTAEKREGVVVRVSGSGTKASTEADGTVKTEIDGEVVQPERGQIEREVERLQSLLDHVVKLREDITKGMEVLLWREKLLELAKDRAKAGKSCGWDQRLCFSDEEVTE